MAVTAVERLTRPVRMLGNLVAASATFRSVTGSEDAATARLRVYDVAESNAEFIRPCAIVMRCKGESTTKRVSSGSYRDTTVLDVSFEFPIAIVVTVERVGNIATATYEAHGLAESDVVHVYDAEQAEYNGRHTITAVTADTFSWAVTGTPASPATGVIKAIAAVPQFANEDYRFANAVGAIVSEMLDLSGTGADPEFTNLSYYVIQEMEQTEGPGRCLEAEANVRESYYGVTYRVTRGL